jgi:hypothetical protein
VSKQDASPQGEEPEVILAVQTGAGGGIVLGEVITTSAPHHVLIEAVHRAMQEPLFGKPRRPAVLRVESVAEAELLALSPVMAGIALEVVGELADLNAVQAQMEQQLSGLHSDYRTQAARAGETLSLEGLRAFFQTARKFYREAMWEAYGDEVLFELHLQPSAGAEKTLYGVIIGQLGQELGLALYPSLDALQQFYALSMEHEEFLAPDEPVPPPKRSEPQRRPDEAAALARFLEISTLCLTYTPQREVPPPLVAEAKQLKFPLAKAAAFPLVMRTGQGGMRIATGRELADMYVALGAILDWDQRIDDTDGEDEVDITLTSQVAAIPAFLPAMTVQTTLRNNPYLPADEDADEDMDNSEWMGGLAEIFESLFEEPPGRQTPAKPGTRQSTSRQKAATALPAAERAPNANRVYTLDVYLSNGPLSAAYANQEISRRIEILGHQTLHDLHQAIFEAFERWEEHLYAFNLGEGPGDRSQVYFYTGGVDEANEEMGDPTTTPLGALGLEVGRRFGYIFDMGDHWEHIIDVRAVADLRGKKQYPRLAKKVGKAPPQYPDDEDEG